MMKPCRPGLVMVVLVAVTLALLTLSGSSHAVAQVSDAGTGHVTVGDSSEGWYSTSTSASCSSSVGCPPMTIPAASPYPANTLHVGLVAGGETARFYVKPDLSVLSAEAQPAGGIMTLPVSIDQSAGNENVNQAQIIACLAIDPFTDGADGSTAPPPQVDCTQQSAASYQTKSGTFTVDLTPFLNAWESGAADDGIALVPDPKSGPTSFWQVSFNGRHLAGSPPITSTISLPTPAKSADHVSPPYQVNPSELSTAMGSTSISPQLRTTAAGLLGPQLSEAVQVGATPRSIVPLASVSVWIPFHFRYPEVLFLPLVLLVGAIFSVRTFTKPATPMRFKSLNPED